MFVLVLAGALVSLPAQSQQSAPALTVQQQTDPSAALKHWWPLAHRGDAEAQYQLGILYGTGRGLTQDLVKSAEWHRRAAEQGHDRAQAMVGLFYNTGQGVRETRPKPSNGGANPRLRATRTPGSIWAWPIGRAMGCRRILTRPPFCSARWRPRATPTRGRFLAPERCRDHPHLRRLPKSRRQSPSCRYLQV